MRRKTTTNDSLDEASQAEQDETDRGPISRRRRWLFRGAAVVVGILPLLLLEVALRMISGSAADAVDVDPVTELTGAKPLFERDHSGLRWVIPEQRMNYFRPASFPAAKPASTRRIFVLGGSTVQGRPYAHETAFSTWLELRLRAAAPDRDFEVINCGGVSYASYRVAKILDEVLTHQPDAIVLYTGHNEFLEERSYADVRSMSDFSKWIDRVGSQLETVRQVRRMLAGPRPQPLGNLAVEVDARLDHAGGMESYRRDPAWRSAVEDAFAETLRRMLAKTRQSGVPLILCVPASDLVRTPPFKTMPPPGMDSARLSTFDRAWSTAVDPEQAETRRVQAARRVLKLDPEHAGAHFVLGTLQYQRLESRTMGGTTRSARHHLVCARDFDVCPLRATSPIVDAVVRLGQDFAVPLVDTRQILDQRRVGGMAVPDGIPDPENFVDHVHPAIHGHQRIATAVAREFELLGWIELDSKAEQRYQAMAASHLSGLDEPYFQRGQQRLEGLRRWAAGRAAAVGTD